MIKEVIKKTYLYKLYSQHKEAKIRELQKIRSRYFKLEAEELLCKFSKALNSENILFWLEFGTFLGYYRENDFIVHDCDLDVGAMRKDADTIRKVLTTLGFKLVHKFYSLDGDAYEECFQYMHTTIDVVYFEVENDLMYCHCFATIGAHNIKAGKMYKATTNRISYPYAGFEKVEFKGTNVYVPSNAFEHLSASYGVNFMTPDPNYDPKVTATNKLYYSYNEKPSALVVYKREKYS